MAALCLDVVHADLPRLRADAQLGGLFVVGGDLAAGEDGELELRCGAASLTLAIRAVWNAEQGVGVEFREPSERARVIAWLEARTAAPSADPGPDDAIDLDALTADLASDEPLPDLELALNDDADAATDADDENDADADGDGAAGPTGLPREQQALHVRLRNLTMVQQLKVAREGETAERMLLERLYGKAVWDALLRNPRLTVPEVARIARMGSLPKPMVELIVSNGAWLAAGEVRRSLLGNPRLAPEQVPRVLRHVPKHELKLIPTQTAYPAAVRDVARRLLRGAG